MKYLTLIGIVALLTACSEKPPTVEELLNDRDLYLQKVEECRSLTLAEEMASQLCANISQAQRKMRNGETVKQKTTYDGPKTLPEIQ